MKRSTRLISIILATILCGASFAACATSSTPPVTESFSSSTAVSPLNEDTEGDTTSEASATVEPIDNTTEPDSDEAAVDTGSAEDTMATNGQSTLNDLLYYTDDGYVKIKGSDKIKLPGNGVYLHYDKYPEVEYFMSAQLQTTELLSDVPLYNGTNSPHSYSMEDGRIVLQYNNGEKTFGFDSKLTALDIEGNEHVFNNITDHGFCCYYISPELSYFIYRGECSCGEDHALLIKIHNMGENAEFIAVHPDVYIHSIWLSENGVGYATSGGMGAAGAVIYNVYYTADGGKSFSKIDMIFYSQKLNCGKVDFSYIDDTIYVIGDIHAENIASAVFLHKTVDTSSYKCWDFYSGLYGNGRYLECAPFFDNNIGVKAVLVQIGDYYVNSTNEGIIQGYMYFISLDHGETWVLYEPPTCSLEIEFSGKPEPK